MKIKVSNIGESVTEATIVQWLAKDMEHVEEGQDIVELSTEKAIFTIQSPKAGSLKRLKNEGDIVRLNEDIAEIEG